MAKALFHKSQRVYVKPVGTWALVEQVIPHWVKDVDEPLRVTYECGLGRQFQAHELASEEAVNSNRKSSVREEEDYIWEHWRIVRRTAQWRNRGVGHDKTDLGTFPVVVTDEDDIGGWRVPGSEYDRDADRIEHQARIIACAPDLMRVARQVAEYAAENPDKCPDEMKPVTQHCASILRFVYQLDCDGNSASVAAE